ncbi:MAG: hypothetical protein IKT03_05875 [Muribaculaceae bacterium]|nr:hypothetical protein [Muribaculaceae bacterium]
MKKILFTIALTITLGLTASAQKDGFFSNWDDYGNGLDRTGSDIGFVLPSNHGYGVDTPSAPLGSGLLVLTALGAGYAVARRRKNQV